MVFLFHAFAIFPEDVPIPSALFDHFAVACFGGAGKRPWLQVRSWLTALMRLSLVNGSLQDGCFMHDIVRDYTISRCPDVRARHRNLLQAIVDTPPKGGWLEAAFAGRGNLTWYVAIHGCYHIRQAVDADEAHDPLIDQLVLDVVYDGT